MNATMLARADCRYLPVADSSIDLIFTDPPYAAEFLDCYRWLASEALRVLRVEGFVLCMCGRSYINQIFRMFDDAGLTYFYELQQKSGGPAPTVYRDNTHEGGYPLLARTKSVLAYSKGPGRPRVGNMANLFDTGAEWTLSKRYHAWGQDVASARYWIDHFSGPGELVLDPFVGGGTTIIAAEVIGRRAIGFDIDPEALRTTKARRETSQLPTVLPLFAMTGLGEA